MGRVYTSLSFLFCLLFLIASSPASAGELRREGFRYEIEFPYSQTVIEGFVVDSSGEGIENASITGWAHSDTILIDVKTDNNGYFRIVLPGGENHEYSLNINENHYGYNEGHPYRGFDNDNVKNMIKSGEHHRLRILLNYNPFDIKLVNPSTKEPENSGSLTRGYTSSSYSGRGSVPFLAQRAVPVLDSSGNPVYDTVEEKVLTGYTWEEKVTKYSTDTKTLGTSDGEWRDTGETFTEGWFNPKPSLPSGYRWVEVSRGYTFGIWTTTTFKKQYNAVGYYRTQGYSVTASTESYVSGYRTESYQEWVPGQYETRTQTVTKYRTESYSYTLPVPVPKWETQTYQEWVWQLNPFASGFPGYWATHTRQVLTWGLEWRTFSRTRQVPYTTTESYQAWVPGGYVTKTRSVPIYSTRVTGYTATKQVPYEVWETKSSTTRPNLYNDILGNPRDDIRNLKEVYTTTTRQVPRTNVETYTAYRIYEYGGTHYSLLPWGEKQTTVTATPKNGYTGDVRLEVEAGDGVEATLGSSVLSFSSPAQTTLSMRPMHASVHSIVVKAYDLNGRLVTTRTYELGLESPSPGSYWERYVGTAEQPDDIPATITSTSTSTVDVQMPGHITVPTLDVDLGGGPVYDDGTFGGPMTRLYTYDPSRGYLYDSVMWTEDGVTFTANNEYVDDQGLSLPISLS